MHRPLALIVDDEPDILELLQITLARMDVDCIATADLSQAGQALRSHRFDVCLTDMRLPDGDGIELVKTIAAGFPNLPVAVITAHGNMQTAIEAMKAGAFDFVSKPVDLGVLRRLVAAALKLHGTTGERKQATTFLGASRAIENIRHMVGKLARSQAPVYVSGESGTGKELVARLIHEGGPRSDAEFVAVNCGALPRELIESELFGHRKGSFTGAMTDKAGLFQAADGGTLFLDEIADLPLDMQVKLLRAIQEKAVRPIGSQREDAVDVRIISATHRDLGALVERREFREDLFYRINVIELPIPPLRERRDDIRPLADHILSRLARKSGREKPHMDDAAMDCLLDYDFPGNVRELENILERAVALCENDHISPEDLQFGHRPRKSAQAIQPVQPETPDDRPLEDFLGEVEKQAIRRVLEETHWNRTAAARKLGMTLRSLRYRMSKLGLD